VANLKSIRKRISSVKSTQKITRAMKMVAGARLTRAQQRITAMRPYAVKLGQMLAKVTAATAQRTALLGEGVAENEGVVIEAEHPLLARRHEKTVLLVVVTSDRGLCGAFNSNINRYAERQYRQLESEGKHVKLAVIGRKGREYFTRRGYALWHVFSNVWQDLGTEQAELVARTLVQPFAHGEVDSIYLIYNEFKSAMLQRVVCSPLFPLSVEDEPKVESSDTEVERSKIEFDFEPTKDDVLEQLVPTYLEMTLLRSLYESQASEFGARMTAMDAATKNAFEMIDRYTLLYNRARQAAITTELMEIIGGANALKE
jgi:F-type H+-transporting ATPase subunit gamma